MLGSCRRLDHPPRRVVRDGRRCAELPVAQYLFNREQHDGNQAYENLADME